MIYRCQVRGKYNGHLWSSVFLISEIQFNLMCFIGMKNDGKFEFKNFCSLVWCIKSHIKFNKNCASNEITISLFVVSEAHGPIAAA